MKNNNENDSSIFLLENMTASFNHIGNTFIICFVCFLSAFICTATSSKWIFKPNWIISHEGVEVDAASKTDRILLQESPTSRIIVPGPEVIQSCLRIQLPSRVGVRILPRSRLLDDVPIGVVRIALGSGAGAIRQIRH